MKRRMVWVGAGILLVGVLVVAAVYRPNPAPTKSAPTLDEMADDIGAQVMRHIYRGHVAGRSGDIFLVPKPHRFILGNWDLRTLGSDDSPLPASSHPNPWAYLTRVPIILYGPGYIPNGKRSYKPVDISALAPTYARLLGIEDFWSPSCPLPLIASCKRSSEIERPPRAIVTVVLDGGGWNVLQEHPDAWPNLMGLARRGTTYLNATLGSAPSITGALHATFGTGFYPRDHGIPGNQMRDPNGENVDAYLQNADPRFLKKPTVSELWDQRNDNKPFVGTVSYEGWHLGMIGHGAQRSGGDKDVAVLWESEDNAWWINEAYYEMPTYLEETDLERLESYEKALDDADAVADGKWLGHRLDELQDPKTRPGTPAFARFTGDAVMQILRREGVGRDRMTDLFWIEMKMPDYGGHLFNMIGPEQEQVISEIDRQIARFFGYLNRSVGRGNYVFAMSADHGQQPIPETVGGWRINNEELERDIEDRFGPIVEKITPVDIYLDRERVDDLEVDPVDVARYIGTFTIADNIPPDAPGADLVPEGRLTERLFAGAFPSAYIEGLPGRISSFGPSDYPEGDLIIEPPAG